MTRKFSILISCILIAISSFSQKSWFHYSWDSINKQNFTGLYQDIYDFDLKKYKDNIYVGRFYENIAQECASDVCYDAFSGNFYKSIGPSEKYLKSILTTIIKDSTITKNIRIFIYRDIHANASMNESGILRLYIGEIARANNEAELAMIMGHEVGHFLNEDMIKSYGRAIEGVNNSWNNEIVIYSWLKIRLNTPWIDNYWYSREEEAAADFAAINFMKASPYSLKSGANIFKQMKRMEVRAEIVYGKNLKKYSTHPDPGDRLKQVKLLSSDSLNKNKKNFVVDSIAFVKLKELCYQETINIGLQENKVNELIDLTFTRYLFEPDNQYNLAVLIESIRRSLIINKKSEKKSFILDRYQTDNVKNSENYAFLNKENPCILNFLTKGFLDIGKEDIAKIKAKELLDSTKTEFVTNIEAFAYFKKKADELDCKVCTHYKYFEKVPDYNTVDDFISINSLFETNDFLKEKGGIQKLENEMFVVLPNEITFGDAAINRKTIQEQSDFNNQLVESLNVALSKPVVKLFDLPYKDQHLLMSLVNVSSDIAKLVENSGINKYSINWLETPPELYSFFTRNKVKTIYVCKTRLVQSLNGKQSEYFYLYKITAPEKNKYSFCANIKKGESALTEDYKSYINKFSGAVLNFYNWTK